MEAVILSLNRIIPGMIVTQDIFSKSNEKLASKNTIINAKMLNSLKLHSIQQIPVLIPPSLADRVQTDTHVNKLRDSLEFKKFKRSYLNTTENVKSLFSDMTGSAAKNITPDKILEGVSPLLAECENSMHTFDMLHCMRDFDDLTYVHSLNVSLICHSIAAWLNFNEEDTRLVTVAGLIHDIGKIKIPEEILKKPSKLTDDEYRIMKAHTILGSQIISGTNLDPRIKDAVLSHHENYDGSGYPYGKRGDEIHSFTKIVTLADVYDAMTANRVYREGICPFDVVATLEEEGFHKYDPAYLLPFLKHIVQSYINAPVMLTNTLVGEVVMINQDHLSKPIVKVDDQFFDLSRKTDIKIKCLL